MKTILIVDDDFRIRRLCWQILTDQYNTLTAGSVNEAIKRIEGARIDLVISDLYFDDDPENGYGLMRVIRKHFPWIPILAITGQGDIYDVDKCGLLDVKEFLFKPFSPSNLLAKIHDMLQEERSDETASISR